MRNGGKVDCFCSECDASFRHRQQLSRHRQKEHGHVVGSRPGTVVCGLCRHSFLSPSNLCSHVQEVHGENAQVETINFPSRTQYEEWLWSQATLFHFQLSCSSTRVSDSTRTRHLYCHRSSLSNISKSTYKGIRKPKTGQIKIGFACTCHAVEREQLDSGDISVTYCWHHYGHDLAMERFRLSDGTRRHVAELLHQGNDTEDILGVVRRDCEQGVDVFSLRDARITRKDIHNIQAGLSLYPTATSSPIHTWRSPSSESEEAVTENDSELLLESAKRDLDALERILATCQDVERLKALKETIGSCLETCQELCGTADSEIQSRLAHDWQETEDRLWIVPRLC